MLPISVLFDDQRSSVAKDQTCRYRYFCGMWCVIAQSAPLCNKPPSYVKHSQDLVSHGVCCRINSSVHTTAHQACAEGRLGLFIPGRFCGCLVGVADVND